MHFLCFLAFFEQKKEAYGLHFATVASGELVKHSSDQGGVRRYNCVVKCKGVARTHDQIFSKKSAKIVCFLCFLAFFLIQNRYIYPHITQIHSKLFYTKIIENYNKLIKIIFLGSENYLSLAYSVFFY